LPLLLLSPSLFSDYSFLLHHPVNKEDRHLAHAMASDFTVTWQTKYRTEVAEKCETYNFGLNS
jgi:hypothetical protein